ncbi:MAG: Uma2 family endonuclease [Pirellulales bacterium]
MSTASRFVPNYTVDDYRHWEGDWQLIEGVPVAMSPSPFGPHERIAIELATSFKNQIDQQGCDCRVYAGLDWIVSNDTVVRPDVMVVCGPQPERHLERPPAIAVEILSPATRELDLVAKRRIYQQNGVAFYLIAGPQAQQIEIARMNVQTSESETIHEDQTAELQLSEDCQITLNARHMFR